MADGRLVEQVATRVLLAKSQDQTVDAIAVSEDAWKVLEAEFAAMPTTMVTVDAEEAYGDARLEILGVPVLHIVTDDGVVFHVLTRFSPTLPTTEGRFYG